MNQNLSGTGILANDGGNGFRICMDSLGYGSSAFKNDLSQSHLI